MKPVAGLHADFGLSSKPYPGLSAYVHVPFCKVRCGYCDFNTYTATDLGPGAALSTYPGTVVAEIAQAAQQQRLRGDKRVLDTVFFGGGTPTRLEATQLADILAALRQNFGLAPGAEVTTEANPDSVTQADLQHLAAKGFTRVSVGMQSAVPRVLQILDRTHQPARVAQVLGWAKQLGLETSVDLIYATPTETIAEWRESLEAVLEMQPDHISAYALVIEEGTKMGADLRRGLIDPVDPDQEASKYELADALLAANDYDWYEISNWAKSACVCRHNLAYWYSHDWLGFGPGAHSHLAGRRWWNHKHPRVWAQAVLNNTSPVAGEELLDQQQQRTEETMLRLRLRSGLPFVNPGPALKAEVAQLVANGLVEVVTLHGQPRIVLTVTGRLLADRVTGALLAISEIAPGKVP